MTTDGNPVAGSEPSMSTSNRVGLYSSILTVVMTVVTFSLAIIAIPNSGAGCREDCVEYPYLNTQSEFPGAYLWMPSAMVLVVVYVILVASIHAHANQHRKIYSQIGLSFALIAAAILLSDYFVFIVLEELGCLLMSLSFLFLAPAFANEARLASVVRWVFVAGFVLTIVFLVVISINHGLDRMDRFEIAAISIVWLVLVINGVLLSVLFRRQLKVSRVPHGQPQS
jgi:hypothetical protein